MRRNIQRHNDEQLWGIVGSWALVFHISVLYMKYILRQSKKSDVPMGCIKKYRNFTF